MRRVISGEHRRVAAVLGFIGFAWLSSGCASTMMVFTEPGNAEIVVDGEVIGTSPILYAGDFGGVKVTAQLPGYHDATVDVSRELFYWGLYLPDAGYIRFGGVVGGRGAFFLGGGPALGQEKPPVSPSASSGPSGRVEPPAASPAGPPAQVMGLSPQARILVGL